MLHSERVLAQQAETPSPESNHEGHPTSIFTHHTFGAKAHFTLAPLAKPLFFPPVFHPEIVTKYFLRLIILASMFAPLAKQAGGNDRFC